MLRFGSLSCELSFISYRVHFKSTKAIRPMTKAYISLRRTIFTLGPCVGLDPKRHNLPYPNAEPKICVTPNAKPKRQSVECRLRWVSNANIFCVHFIRIGYRFSVKYGLKGSHVKIHR